MSADIEYNSTGTLTTHVSLRFTDILITVNYINGR